MNRIIKVIFLSFLLLFCFSTKVEAQVVINEISPSGEWVELYNPSSTDINLDGCILLMGSDSQDVNYISSDTILALSFKVAEKEVTTEWTGNWLNNSGDTVTLDCPSVGDDAITYEDNVDLKTYGRSPNGSGSFMVLESATKGSANSAPQPTFTPTPTSTPTPTPTSSPTNSPTPVPTPTKTPTPTPIKTSTPVPTSTDTPVEEILGTETVLPSPTPVETQKPIGNTKNTFPFLAIGLIILGLGFVGFSIYIIIKNVKKDRPQIS